METSTDRRTEERLRYHWPIWYTDAADQQISQGQMVDINSHSAAFTSHTTDFCPLPYEQIRARFSVPKYGEEEAFQITDFVRTAQVHRVERVAPYLNRIVVRFHEPLSFKPGEQGSFVERNQEAVIPVSV